tara:strand:- start:185 stop:412 length:228 start_codon:yes stop_codon:yes gene_type:complete
MIHQLKTARLDILIVIEELPVGCNFFKVANVAVMGQLGEVGKLLDVALRRAKKVRGAFLMNTSETNQASQTNWVG